MKCLILNSGSSSVKYELFDGPEMRVVIRDLVGRIGEPDGPADHRAAFDLVLRALGESGALTDISDLAVVGHRVVHGGDRFSAPTVIDAGVVDAIRALIPLAPLHNEPNLQGIEIGLSVFPGVPHVAVFDTAFHQTMPPEAYLYAIPRHYQRDFGVRRYGFHGTSHRYVSKRAAALLDRPLESLAIVTLHLGNGASACAVLGGRSVDTSMGMTPLDGLAMGTRCGDLDPAIPFHLERKGRMSPKHVLWMLNHESGLKGLCGRSDMRDVRARAESGHADASEAFNLFCYRVRKMIGAYAFAMGRIDAVVFTGGIGENDAAVRTKVCEGLAAFGIEVDPARNEYDRDDERAIGADGSRVPLLVIPTDEEREIATQALECVNAKKQTR